MLRNPKYPAPIPGSGCIGPWHSVVRIVAAYKINVLTSKTRPSVSEPGFQKINMSLCNTKIWFINGVDNVN